MGGIARLVDEGSSLASVTDSGIGVAIMMLTLAVFYNADSMLDGCSSSVAGILFGGDYGVGGYDIGNVVVGSSAASDF